jgi:uncharacterized protein YkwD
MVARSTGVHVALLALFASFVVACDPGQTNTVSSRYRRGSAQSSGSGQGSNTNDSADDGDDDGEEAASSSGNSGTPSPAGTTGSMGGSGAAPPSDGTLEQACVNEINKYRATVGAPALQRWTAGETCATEQSMEDSKSGRAHGAFGKCKEFAQNECPGWAGPGNTMIAGCLKAMWGEGPGGGHYENMKSGKYTQVACGFYTGTDGKIWSVQNFK